jgi:outer membrane biosynthesis protein TonB
VKAALDVAPRRSRLPRLAAGALGLCAAIGLIVAVVKAMLAESGKPIRPSVQQIAILKPPPPPPPKPEPKPPEPEIKPETVKVPEPKMEDEPKADERPPASEQLGVDADGTAGSDAFGLAARKGGRDITTIGGDKGGGRSAFAYYTGQLQRLLQDELTRNKALAGKDYRIGVLLWLAPNGRVERVDLSESSGSEATDKLIRGALLSLNLRPPPENMPRPVGVRINSRGSG